MDLEKHFSEISEKPFNYLPKYIAPHLVGDEWHWIRRALLMILTTKNNTRSRVRLHMLLIGEPGTGKTEYLLWARENFETMMINAELTSKVGLVGDARGKTVHAGLLADCDGHLVLVDELDKMNSKDQNGLLQAMEEGSYTIIKGKNRERFKAEVRIIASANYLTKIQRPLLDRFDFVFFVGTTTREERAKNVERLMNSFLRESKAGYQKTIIQYLKWVNDEDIITKFHEPDRQIIKNNLEQYILYTKTKIRNVSYRSLELSILRVAYSIARLEKSDITSKHVNTAIWLKDQIIKNLV